MNHSHIARPTIYDPAVDAGGAGSAAERKWPLKWTFVFVVTMSITLWAGTISAVWHLI